MGDAVLNAKYKVKFYIPSPRKNVDKNDVNRLNSGVKSVFFARQKRRCWCVATFNSSDVTLVEQRTRVADLLLGCEKKIDRKTRSSIPSLPDPPASNQLSTLTC